VSRTEKPTVADAIALPDFDGGLQQTARPLDQCDRDVVRLLQVILAIFRQRNVDWLPSSDLIEGLWPIVGRLPWTGKSAEDLREAQKLAGLLRPLFIRPKPIRREGRHANGYERRWFQEALIRVAASGVRWS
jgi:hypothetical protein